MMNDAALLVNPKHVNDLISKATLGMEVARQLAAFAVVCASGCACSVKAGKHYGDTDGNVYVTVVVERTVCKAHTAYTSPLYAGEILYRLAINDAHDVPAAVQVAPESAAVIKPRLHEIDMDDLKRCIDADLCMM